MDAMKPGTITLGPASLHLGYSAMVPPNLRGNAFEITDLLTAVNERGQNHANSLMQDVCEQADQAGKLLLLMPESYGQVGLTTDELSDWYQRRHGFVVLQLSPKIILVRMPSKAAKLWAGQ
jgi:hypothetical protein